MLKRFLYSKLYKNFYELNWDIDPSMPVDKACFVVFDTETTGLNLKRDEPIALGALRIKALRIDLSEAYYTLIRTTRKLGQSVKVHGIGPAKLRDAKEPSEVCREFISYSKNCLLVGYFLHIDVAMIKKLVKRECGGAFVPYGVDIVDMLEGRENLPTLEELLTKLRLPKSDFHNPLEDAYMTALVFLKLLKDKNYKKIKDLPYGIY